MVCQRCRAERQQHWKLIERVAKLQLCVAQCRRFDADAGRITRQIGHEKEDFLQVIYIMQGPCDSSPSFAIDPHVHTHVHWSHSHIWSSRQILPSRYLCPNVIGSTLYNAATSGLSTACEASRALAQPVTVPAHCVSASALSQSCCTIQTLLLLMSAGQWPRVPLPLQMSAAPGCPLWLASPCPT